MIHLLKILILIAILLSSCSQQDPFYVKQACEEWTTAYAQWTSRCRGIDLETAKEQIKFIEFKGDCANVQSIRDRDKLLSTCVFAIRTTESCGSTDISEALQMPECKQQFTLK